MTIFDFLFDILLLECFIRFSWCRAMTTEGNTPAKGGISLYANLLDPSDDATPGTIARGPVVFKQPAEDDAQQDDAATSKKQQISSGRGHTLLIQTPV